MAWFSKKSDEQETYIVESETPRDENNTTTHYCSTKEQAKEKAKELGQRETNVTIKKVR